MRPARGGRTARSGKSTVGTLLAEPLGVDFRDADDDIVERTGRGISDIFAATANRLSARWRKWPSTAGCVSTRGSSRSVTWRLRRLRGGTRRTPRRVDVNVAEGVRRTGLSTARPLLAGVNPRATYRTLLETRLPLYRQVADVEVDTSSRSPDEVVDEIVANLSAADENRGG